MYTYSSFCSVSCFVLLSYDCLITAPQEITHVWLERSSSLKWVYLLQRYLPFVDITLICLQCESSRCCLTDVQRFCRFPSESFLLSCYYDRVWHHWRYVTDYQGFQVSRLCFVGIAIFGICVSGGKQDCILYSLANR
jgi:hypothetical protein